MISPEISPSTDFYNREFGRTQRLFESTGDGRAAILARAELVDSVIRAVYRSKISADISGPEGFCLVALGGYGRRELFPHSDVDFLFLSENARAFSSLRDATAAAAVACWDLGLRVSNTSRELSECGELKRDNLEFSVSLLDCRHVAGDARLFERLRERVVPHLVARDRADLVNDLVNMTEERRKKHENTIFHLEPNLKDAPGGLRDFHVARWLAVIFELDRSGRWGDPEELWPPELSSKASASFQFLAAARSFLHYHYQRDDNRLTYELQDGAAAAGFGIEPRAALPPEDWMRHYFQHARSTDRLLTTLLDEAASSRTSLYGMFQDWRSRLSTPDFSVVRGRIYSRQPTAALGDPVTLLSMFELTARHGLDLSRDAERCVAEAIAHFSESSGRAPGLWQGFRNILLAPRASQALRAMHRLGLLDALFPEFRAIDSLVVRDFYHRYTVDAHSLLTLENLDRLRRSKGEPPLAGWDLKFSDIRAELERPELLYLALIFHDVGKGLDEEDHVRGSLAAVEPVFERLALAAEDCETVRFLIRDHLIMSATLMRRDIFDPETVREFAEKIGTTERLKMLCLLTYADVKSVNPQALTPWKAQMLWQLYAATENYLTRSLDEDRVHASQQEKSLAQRVLESLGDSSKSAALSEFLEGFPRRYLLTHTPEEIAGHFLMAERLARESVQVKLDTRPNCFELTVVTQDRPRLFASITGALAAWGMNILKADAFSNAAGTVLDTLRFSDLFRTLELNPSESERLARSVTDVLAGKADLRQMLRGRMESETHPSAKVPVPTQVRFEPAPVSHPGAAPRSTILEVITYDRPGVLYRISSTLAELGINIEVALIDTEGQKVIDVFYLTSGGAPLDAALQASARDSLVQKLR